MKTNRGQYDLAIILLLFDTLKWQLIQQSNDIKLDKKPSISSFFNFHKIDENENDMYNLNVLTAFEFHLSKESASMIRNDIYRSRFSRDLVTMESYQMRKNYYEYLKNSKERKDDERKIMLAAFLLGPHIMSIYSTQGSNNIHTYYRKASSKLFRIMR